MTGDITGDVTNDRPNDRTGGRPSDATGDMAAPGDQAWLSDRFERDRPRLAAIAYRMLGSRDEADDAVQEAWLRLSRSDAGAIANLGGWLTTVVARVCLDILRSRTSRREEPLDADGAAHADANGITDAKAMHADPEREAVLADSIGLAMLVVLETLAPAERVAFVLHDMFAIPFDDIAPIVGRSPVAARQLASRARRRVQGAAPTSDATLAQRRRIVDAFLAASRAGDFKALIALLDPNAVLLADDATVRMGNAAREVAGAQRVAAQFAGRAQAARPATVAGAPGLAWGPPQNPKVVFVFTFEGERIARIDLIADAARIAELGVVIL